MYKNIATFIRTETVLSTKYLCRACLETLHTASAFEKKRLHPGGKSNRVHKATLAETDTELIYAFQPL